MERYYPSHRSTEPQCFLSGSRSTDPSCFDPASRSFCSSTPLYRHYDQHDRAQSVIPQCLTQRYQKHSLQSQSCRPMLIHNSFSDNSFEYRSSLANSVGVHRGWRSMLQQPSDVPTKSCSVDLCQDGYCHNPHTRPNVTRRDSFPPPVKAPASGMMHVIEENNGDRVMSTSDEEGESYGNASDVYPLTQNTGSLAGQFWSEQADVPEVQSLYAWIIKLLPDKSGPCVEGKLREEDDTFWHSSLIAKRLNSHLVQTVSGKLYQLMGDMEVEEALFGGFDEQTVREFVYGFPTHWRDVVDRFFLRVAAKSPDPELSDNDVDDDDISLLEETLTPSEDKQTPETASVTESKEKVGIPKKVIAKKPMTRARKSDEGKKSPPAKISPPKNVEKKRKSVNENVVNGDVNLVEETLNPSEDKQITEVKESKKKVGRPKKVVAKLPVTRVRKSDKGMEAPPAKEKSPPNSVKVSKRKSATTLLNESVTEMYTPNGKMIHLDAVQTTRSGRAVKPVVAWYTGQSVSINPDTNSYVIKYRTQSAESFHKDMAELFKTRSHVSRKTLNVSKISQRNQSSKKKEKVVKAGKKKEETVNVEKKKGKTVSGEKKRKEAVKKETSKNKKEAVKEGMSEKKKEAVKEGMSEKKKEAVKGRKKKDEGKENEVTQRSDVTWTKEEVTRFNLIVRKLNQDDPEFWNKVMNYIRTKTMEECQEHFYKAMSSRKRPSKPQHSEDPKEQKVTLTAKKGSLKRKQQLRDLVDHSNKRYQEDLFDGTPYRHNSKMPRLSGDQQDDVFAELSKRNPHMMNKVFTPMTRINVDPVSTKKTPSSGLSVDPKINRKDADQYIHKMNIQQRKFVNKKTKPSKDKVKIPVPNKKLFSKSDDLQSLLMERCESDSNHDDSDQESDYYFSEEGDV